MLGIDKGTTYTKTDKGLIIRSTVRPYRENEILIDNDKTVVEYKDKKYIVGEKGNYSTDLMKSEHENTKLLILTAIALTYQDNYISTNIVTGLPIGLYSAQKERMKEILQINHTHKISVNKQNKYIKLKNIEAFPESAGAFYSQSKYVSGLVIDLGGLSVDMALFERQKLTKYSTYSMGVMKLYSKIANYINSSHDLSLTEWDIEDVVVNGLYIYGKKVELNLDSIIKQHVEEIIERLKLEYDLKIIENIFITGGGGQLLCNHIKEYIPQATILSGGQFSNAIGYRNVGKVIFNV